MFSVRGLTKEEIIAYDFVPKNVINQVKIINIPNIMGTFKGLTIGKYIFISKKIPCDGSSHLIAHELVHVRQWNELGIIGFTVKYLSDFFSKLIKHKNWINAYSEIILESEARDISQKWSEQKCS